jgi:hypothetical protein
VDILIIQQDQELVKDKAAEFNSYLEKFSHFYEDSPEENVNEKLLQELEEDEINQIEKDSASDGLSSPDQLPTNP